MQATEYSDYSKPKGINNVKISEQIGIRGNILLIKTNEFTPRSSKNYCLKWKPKDQEYYKLFAGEGSDLYKTLG